MASGSAVQPQPQNRKAQPQPLRLRACGTDFQKLSRLDIRKLTDPAIIYS